MDYLQFTSAVIGNLAWPLVIVVLLIVLRAHMRSLADRLLELSFGGAKLTFDKVLQKGAEIIEQTPAPEPGPPSTRTVASDGKRKKVPARRMARTLRASHIFPQGSYKSDDTVDRIIEEYERVNHLLFDIGDCIGIDAANASSVMAALNSKGVITDDINLLYTALGEARSLVVHGRASPGHRDELEYIRQAIYLYQYLQNLRDKIASGEVKVPE